MSALAVLEQPDARPSAEARGGVPSLSAQPLPFSVAAAVSSLPDIDTLIRRTVAAAPAANGASGAVAGHAAAASAIRGPCIHVKFVPSFTTESTVRDILSTVSPVATPASAAIVAPEPSATAEGGDNGGGDAHEAAAPPVHRTPVKVVRWQHTTIHRTDFVALLESAAAVAEVVKALAEHPYRFARRRGPHPSGYTGNGSNVPSMTAVAVESFAEALPTAEARSTAALTAPETAWSVFEAAPKLSYALMPMVDANHFRMRLTQEPATLVRKLDVMMSLPTVVAGDWGRFADGEDRVPLGRDRGAGGGGGGRRRGGGGGGGRGGKRARSDSPPRRRR